jgi:hypothetical protein
VEITKQLSFSKARKWAPFVRSCAFRIGRAVICAIWIVHDPQFTRKLVKNWGIYEDQNSLTMIVPEINVVRRTHFVIKEHGETKHRQAEA